MPGRFTGAMFVAEAKRFRAAQAGAANLRRSCALITSSVDCCRAGHMWGGPAGPAGLATPLPDRVGEQAGGRQQGMTEAKVIKSRAGKGKARVTLTVDPRAGAQAAAVCGEWNDWSADADVMHRDAERGFSVTDRPGRGAGLPVLVPAGRPAVGQRLGRRRLRPQRLRRGRLGGGPDRAGRGGPAGREEGAGEEGGARADCQEGSARSEASWEDGQIARARRGGAAAGLVAPHRATCPCGFFGRQLCSW